MKNDTNVKVEAARTHGQPTAENTYSPLVDIYEKDDSTVVVAELPGVPKESIRVEVDKGVLTISGPTQWQEPGEKYARTYVGFAPGGFFRAFALSDEVNRDAISAGVSNGVLTLTLPKAEASKTRKIEIKAE